MKIVLLLILISLWMVHATVLLYSVKIGETMILDIGKDVKEWRRIKQGKEEKIVPCSQIVTKQCNIWISSNLKATGDGREQMFQNGTLVISNFMLSDEGDYYSHDELERVHYTLDGQIWQLAKSKISVYAIE